MPISSGLKTIVDADKDALNVSIDALQAIYFAANKRYCQVLPTHDVIPADGVATAPNVTRKPTYQAESLFDFGLVLAAVLPYSLSIDVYDGPTGKGYVIVRETIGNKIKFRHCENEGSETYRSHDWKE